MYDIMILVGFFVEIFHDLGRFATRIRILIHFMETDPYPADQNETDPMYRADYCLKHFKLVCLKIYSLFNLYFRFFKNNYALTI